MLSVIIFFKDLGSSYVPYVFLFSLLVLLQPTTAQLETLAKEKGLEYFGSATNNGELTHTAYTTILSNADNFGQVILGNTLKWDSIEPSQNSFSFTKGDVATSFAQNNGKSLRCHNLVWYNQLPS